MRTIRIGLLFSLSLILCFAVGCSPAEDATTLYQSFLDNAVDAAYFGGERRYARDFFSSDDDENVYAIFDVTSDGSPELVLRSPWGIDIFTSGPDGLICIYSGSSYEKLLNDGSLLYERHGAAPAHVDYAHIQVKNGQEPTRMELSMYDWNEDGLYNGEDRYYLEDTEISENEFKQQIDSIFKIGWDKPKWSPYHP